MGQILWPSKKTIVKKSIVNAADNFNFCTEIKRPEYYASYFLKTNSFQELYFSRTLFSAQNNFENHSFKTEGPLTQGT